MRLRRSVPSTPVNGGVRARLLRPGRQVADRRPDPAANQGPGDPAGAAAGVDLAVSQRAHSGGRHRRGRTSSVPLPPGLAAGACRGEVRPRAGAVQTAAGTAAPERGGPRRPSSHPPAGAGTGPAPTRSGLLPRRRRTVCGRQRLLRHRHPALRARDGAPRRGGLRTTPPRAGSGAPWRSTIPMWSARCAR